MKCIKRKRSFIIMMAAILIIVECRNFSCLGVGKTGIVINEPMKKILIDPGHGGFDGGAVSKRRTVEKDINLKISLKLREKLQAEGFDVVMTREDDKALGQDNKSINGKKNRDLSARCKLKNQCGCDLFLSIHLNMFPQDYCYGAQVWYSKSEESKKIADCIQQNFKQDLDATNNRVAKAAKGEYKILRCDNIPSLIIECGFLSNFAEEQKLKQEEYQQKIADSIAKSVKQYYSTN